jgi:hypothetical protein
MSSWGAEVEPGSVVSANRPSHTSALAAAGGMEDPARMSREGHGTDGVTDTAKQRRFSFLTVGELLSALSAVGLLLYGVAWFTYRGFYDEFELEMEEVGLTYSAILTSAALGSIAIVTVFFIAFSLLMLWVMSEEDLQSLQDLLPEDAPLKLRLAVTCATVYSCWASF